MFYFEILFVLILVLSIAVYCKKIKLPTNNILLPTNDNILLSSNNILLPSNDNILLPSNDNILLPINDNIIECCYMCKKKLHTPNYFAFDKKYCKNCWLYLQKNIFNK